MTTINSQTDEENNNEEDDHEEQNDDNNQNTSRPKWTNAGAGVNRLQMNFGGKRYNTAVQLLNI